MFKKIVRAVAVRVIMLYIYWSGWFGRTVSGANKFSEWSYWYRK